MLRGAAATVQLQRHQLQEAHSEQTHLLAECARLQQALSAASAERSIALRAQELMMQQQQLINASFQDLIEPVWAIDALGTAPGSDATSAAPSAVVAV